MPQRGGLPGLQRSTFRAMVARLPTRADRKSYNQSRFRTHMGGVSGITVTCPQTDSHGAVGERLKRGRLQWRGRPIGWDNSASIGFRRDDLWMVF